MSLLAPLTNLYTSPLYNPPFLQPILRPILHTLTILRTILTTILASHPDSFAASLEDFTILLDEDLVPLEPFVTSFTQYTYHNSFILGCVQLRQQLDVVAGEFASWAADDPWGMVVRVGGPLREVLGELAGELEVVDWLFWGSVFVVYDVVRVVMVLWTSSAPLEKSLSDLYEEDIILRVSLAPFGIIYGFSKFVVRLAVVPFTIAYGLFKVLLRIVLFPFKIPYLLYKLVVFLCGLVVDLFVQHVLPYFAAKVNLMIFDVKYYYNVYTSGIVDLHNAFVDRLQAGLDCNACTSRIVVHYRAFVERVLLTCFSVQASLRNALDVKYYHNTCASRTVVLYRAFVERVLLTYSSAQTNLRNALDFNYYFSACTSRITLLYRVLVERFLSLYASFQVNLRNAFDFNSHLNACTFRINLLYRAVVDRLPHPRNLRNAIDFKYLKCLLLTSPIILRYKAYIKPRLPSLSMENLSNTFDFWYYYNTSPNVRLVKTISNHLSPYISQATTTISTFDFNHYIKTTPVVLLALVFLFIQLFRAGWHYLRRRYRLNQGQPHIWVSLTRSYTAADRMLVRWRPWWTERFSVNWARFMSFNAHRWAMRNVPVFYQEGGVEVGNDRQVEEPPLTMTEKGCLFTGTVVALYVLVVFLALLPFGTGPLFPADVDPFPWTTGLAFTNIHIAWPLTGKDYTRINNLQELIRGASAELEGAEHYAIFSHARNSSETHLRWTASWGSPAWPSFFPLQGLACQKDLNLLRLGVDMARVVFLNEETAVAKLRKELEAAKRACAKLEQVRKVSRKERELDVMQKTCQQATKIVDVTNIVVTKLLQVSAVSDYLKQCILTSHRQSRWSMTASAAGKGRRSWQRCTSSHGISKGPSRRSKTSTKSGTGARDGGS